MFTTFVLLFGKTSGSLGNSITDVVHEKTDYSSLKGYQRAERE